MDDDVMVLRHIIFFDLIHVFLGDLSKIVPVSPQRFSLIAFMTDGIHVGVQGVYNETIILSYMKVDDDQTGIITRKIVIPESGSIDVVLN
jgi:hypothetical protein